MKKLKFIVRYVYYLVKWKPAHSIHSPFVFNFYQNILHKKKHHAVFNLIESLRKDLLKDKRLIEIKDFGAGSLINSSRKRSIKDIAKNSSKSAKYGQLLYRITEYFQPTNFLEIGTSFGISTLYQTSPLLDSKMITLEGDPKTAQIAKQNFENSGRKNIELLQGNFDDTLSSALKSFSHLDYVFFDGNHQQEPTFNYFEQCLKLTHNNSIFIFDDIHWSDGMEEAWKRIQQHPQVTVTIDLFFLGLVFFRKELSKENFVLLF